MAESSPYSAIENKPKRVAANAQFVTGFYEMLLKPPTILGMIVATSALVWNQSLAEWTALIMAGDSKRSLYLLLLVFTLLTGTRLIQSILLAQRDYKAIQATVWDILIFGVVTAFTSGVTFRLFPKGESGGIALTYTVFAMVGAANFYFLYQHRLPKRGKQVDFVVERRIQAVNVVTFLHIAISMATVCIVTTWSPSLLDVAYWTVLITFVSLTVNMLHSWQLTLMPKFLFTNAQDAPEQITKRFRLHFPSAALQMTDLELKEKVLKPESAKFQSVELARATRAQCPEIADLLWSEFGYIYRYVFPTATPVMIRQALLLLLQLFNGFGSLGFIHFYSVISEGKIVGYVKLDGGIRCGIYNWLEKLTLPILLGKIFGWRSLPTILKRSRAVLACQPKLELDELCLTYLLIGVPFRGRGYGRSVIRLLLNALKEKTNDIVISRLLVLVRQHNAVAEKLFLQHGFIRLTADPDQRCAEDPMREIEGAGEALHFYFDFTGNTK
jgi:ribosomal protein S18 acetylase RimI-like enzyme